MSIKAQGRGRGLAMRGAAGDGTGREPEKPPFGGASQGKPPDPPPPDPSYPVPGDPGGRRADTESTSPLDVEPEEPDR